jgi:hypothetical protein
MADSLQEYFPEEIEYGPIHLYLQKKEVVDSNQLRIEYEYILAFLEQSMYAYETNIRNHNANNTLIALRLMFEDGNLIIAEFVQSIKRVDPGTGLIYDGLDVDVVLEFVGFIQCMNTYNSLLEFWFEKNKVMLRKELIFEEEIMRIEVELFNKTL